ncbi:hypothetical protein DFP72DRAFT_850886 [Ephemerocybe angulata]|uniref:Uncharacterized protein n=1 Tax=Ephemerocybe angulata TaxID=980116 RepID=A0A8H6HT01_9AGAR|nr:hypothetical protein DFP72DRAFT_850886 [Tulosesus angulatus]
MFYDIFFDGFSQMVNKVGGDIMLSGSNIAQAWVKGVLAKHRIDLKHILDDVNGDATYIRMISTKHGSLANLHRDFKFELQRSEAERLLRLSGCKIDRTLKMSMHVGKQGLFRTKELGFLPLSSTSRDCGGSRCGCNSVGLSCISHSCLFRSSSMSLAELYNRAESVLHLWKPVLHTYVIHQDLLLRHWVYEYCMFVAQLGNGHKKAKVYVGGVLMQA